MNKIKEFFKGFYSGFKNFGQNISIIVNSLLLGIVYLAGVGLTAILAKFAKKQFLDIKTAKEKKTYWSDLNLKKENIEKYYRQF